MVGIVVVSHSESLANGVVELANQMSQGRCSIAAAGGIDDPDNPIGTDAIRIMSAIKEVYDDSGVVIMMDMGSALLSTEMAIELIDPEMAENVKLCSAPIVEGTMSACVAASANLPVAEVIREASGSLAAKQEHLGEEPDAGEASVSEPAQSFEAKSSAVTEEVTHKVENPHGLHARPAAEIVTALAGFSSDVVLECAGKQANAKSLNAIACLGVKQNDTIRFVISGEDAKAASEVLAELAVNHFGESVSSKQSSEEPEPVETEHIEGTITGIPVCAGIAIGHVVSLETVMPEIPSRAFSSSEEELALVRGAMEATSAAIKAQESDAQIKLGKEQAAIFAAHLLMISDPEIHQKIEQNTGQGMIAEAAVMSAMSELAAQYAESESAYMREREADVWDVTRQLLGAFDGIEEKTIELPDNAIVVAKDLSPAETATLDVSKLAGICLEQGGKTSHSAIIARAMGIPCIVKAENSLELVNNGQEVILDSRAGQLWIDFDDEVKSRLMAERDELNRKKQSQKAAATEPAITADGTVIDVFANIGSADDVKAALENGAEGVGLLRTEFIFQKSDTLPTEDEQYQIYCNIAAALEGRPLTIRSLDVGGDKPLKAYPMTSEENPFLGLRGVRLCLNDLTLFKPQLKAVLRAAIDYPNIQLMIPMISECSELTRVKAIIAQCKEELKISEQDCSLKVGIMIEVPSAVLDAEALAAEADFFSIGTNDLTQYVMASDRGNTSVANLVDYSQPAVIKAIELTCNAAQNAGIPVSMCGEMAGDPDMTQLLVRLGVHKLSASASLLPALKSAIRRVS